MQTIGLIGGMSWESTALYYRWINQAIQKQLGGLHSARIALISVDFHEIEALQHAGDWQASAEVLSQAGKRLKAAGADFLLICTNTMHKVADEVEANSGLPLLHIADATAKKILQNGYRKVGLLGTTFTMSEPFYKNRLSDNFGIEVVVPDEPGQKVMHTIIYDELCLGLVRDESRQQTLNIINKLFAQGAEAVILGCTEITMLIDASCTDVPLLDTTAIHAASAVEHALAKRTG